MARQRYNIGGGSSNTIVLISTGFRANSFCRSVIALDDNQLNTEFIKELYLQTPFRWPTTQAKLWMVFVLGAAPDSSC
jgi:hypothetical protein